MFVQNYEVCKQATETNCYCDFTNPYAPPNFVLQLVNNPSTKQTRISLVGNAKVESPLFGSNSLQTLEQGELKFGAEKTIQGDELYIGKTIEDAEPLQKAWLSLNTLYTEQDISGSDEIPLAAIYKEQGKTILLPSPLSHRGYIKSCQLPLPCQSRFPQQQCSCCCSMP